MATVSPRLDVTSPIPPIDVSPAALWKENRFGPLFARMRAEDPVHYCAHSDFGPYWSVTRHQDIMHVEALPDIYSSS